LLFQNREKFYSYLQLLQSTWRYASHKIISSFDIQSDVAFGICSEAEQQAPWLQRVFFFETDCRELQHIFMANNLQFVLQRVENIGLMEPIEYDWVMRYLKQIEHYLEEYIKTSWAPVSSHVADKDGKHFRLPTAGDGISPATRFPWTDAVKRPAAGTWESNGKKLEPSRSSNTSVLRQNKVHRKAHPRSPASPQPPAPTLSHLIFRRKPNASHICARIKFTHIW
jgi:hypothetical protein